MLNQNENTSSDILSNSIISDSFPSAIEHLDNDNWQWETISADSGSMIDINTSICGSSLHSNLLEEADLTPSFLTGEITNPGFEIFGDRKYLIEDLTIQSTNKDSLWSDSDIYANLISSEPTLNFVNVPVTSIEISNLYSDFRNDAFALQESMDSFAHELLFESNDSADFLLSRAKFEISKKRERTLKKYWKLLDSIKEKEWGCFQDYYRLINEIRELAKELYSSLEESYSKFEKFRKSKIKLSVSKIPIFDFRKLFRSIISFFFKNLDDEAHFFAVEVKSINKTIIISLLKNEHKIKNYTPKLTR